MWRKKKDCNLQALREKVSTRSFESRKKILQSILQGEVSVTRPGIQSQVLYQRKNQTDSGVSQETIFRTSGSLRKDEGYSGCVYERDMNSLTPANALRGDRK